MKIRIVMFALLAFEAVAVEPSLPFKVFTFEEGKGTTTGGGAIFGAQWVNGLDSAHGLRFSGGVSKGYYTYVNAGSASVSGSVSVEALVNPELTSGIHSIVDNQWGYALWIERGKLKFAVMDMIAGAKVVVSLKDVPVGKTSHVGGVYDHAAGKLCVFINGLLENCVSQKVRYPLLGQSTLMIGQGYRAGYMVPQFMGVIDSVKIWKSARVFALYGSPVAPLAQPPIIQYFPGNYFPFNAWAGSVTIRPPMSSGGPIVRYSVSPALPRGLYLEEQTGTIRGILWGSEVPETMFTVTAHNAAGSAAARLWITTAPGATRTVGGSFPGFPAGKLTYVQGLGYQNVGESRTVLKIRDSLRPGGWRFVNDNLDEITMTVPVSANGNNSINPRLNLELSSNGSDQSAFDFFTPQSISNSGGVIPDLRVGQVSYPFSPDNGPYGGWGEAQFFPAATPLHSTHGACDDGQWVNDTRGAPAQTMMVRIPIMIGEGGVMRRDKMIILSGCSTRNLSVFIRDAAQNLVPIYTHDPDVSLGWRAEFNPYHTLLSGLNYLEVYGTSLRGTDGQIAGLSVHGRDYYEDIVEIQSLDGMTTVPRYYTDGNVVYDRFGDATPAASANSNTQTNRDAVLGTSDDGGLIDYVPSARHQNVGNLDLVFPPLASGQIMAEVGQVR